MRSTNARSAALDRSLGLSSRSSTPATVRGSADGAGQRRLFVTTSLDGRSRVVHWSLAVSTSVGRSVFQAAAAKYASASAMALAESFSDASIADGGSAMPCGLVLLPDRAKLPTRLPPELPRALPYS